MNENRDISGKFSFEEMNKINNSIKKLMNKIGQIENNELSGELSGLFDKLLSIQNKLKEKLESQKLIDEDLRESNERFKSIAENIQDGLIIIENGEIVYINSRTTEITGYTIDELKDQLNDNKANNNQFSEFYKHLNKAGTYYGDESIWIKRKDGRRCFLRNRYNTKKVNGTKIVKYIACTDITKQWRNEIVNAFINKVSSAIRIIEDERTFFKILYKEINKIFSDKQISLSFFRGDGDFKYFYIDNCKIKSIEFPVKNTLCSLLLHGEDTMCFSGAELRKLKKEKNIIVKGGLPKSWMGATLFNKDKRHAILVLKDYDNEDAFNSDDLDLLKFISKQITLSIQKNKDEEKIKQLSLSVEQSPACIVITNMEGDIEYVNKRFVDITGYSAEEVIGKNPKFLQSGRTTKKTYQNIWGSIKNKEVWEGILINKKKNGEIYYEQAKISPIINDNGEITHFVAIKEDISEWILKERELLEAKELAEESEQKVKNLLVEMQIKNSEISALLDSAKKILEIASFEKTAKIIFEYCKKLTGAKAGYVALLSENEMENDVLFLDDGGDDCVVDPSLPMPIRGLREHVYKLKETIYENDFINSEWVKFLPEGHVEMKNVLFAPLIIKNETVGVIGLANKATNFSDSDVAIVSAFGELASLALFNSRNIDELTIAKEKAEESDKLKSSFLANMSHEIRTPMNGIIGFSQFLRDPNLEHDNKLRYIKIIHESCWQLLSIVEDIMEISKLETKQIQINNEEFDFSELLEDAYLNFKEQAEQKGIYLKLNFNSDGKKSMLYADKAKTSQILVKLIGNGIKFTHEGSVEIGANLKDDSTEFYVKDTGIGINPKIKDIIFERFRQAETNMARTYGGAGLGLAISKGYVKLMKGEIWVESEEGSGSTFYFSIPLKKPKYTSSPLQENNNPEPIINFKNAKVLVAEDEEINFQYIKRVFNGLGINNIIRARNGLEAVEFIDENDDVDLIMMDLKMPVMNGFEATKMIKSKLPNIPIIAQTALAIQGDKIKAIEAGCNDYVTKPIDYDELLRIIEKYISF